MTSTLGSKNTHVGASVPRKFTNVAQSQRGGPLSFKIWFYMLRWLIFISHLKNNAEDGIIFRWHNFPSHIKKITQMTV